MRRASKIAAASAALSCVFGGQLDSVSGQQFSVAGPRGLKQPGLDFDITRVVQKTAYSDNLRIIFLVGLEGSGHHDMNSVLRMVCKSGNVVCPNICPLADTLYNGVAKFSTYSQYMNSLDRLRTMMADLVALAKGRLSSEGPVLATFHNCENVAGEMSFPNFGGIDKPLQHVDLRLLAEEAERAEIDLRLIYMGRSAQEILVSTTEHRRFGSFAHEARVLVDAAAVIGSSFREVDSDFVTCFAFEENSSPAQASRVAEFVMPSDDSVTLMTQTLVSPASPFVAHTSTGEVHHSQGWELVSHRLQQKLDSVWADHCQ